MPQKQLPIVIGVKTPWNRQLEHDRRDIEIILRQEAYKIGFNEEIEILYLLHRDRLLLREIDVAPLRWRHPIRRRIRIAVANGAQALFARTGGMFAEIVPGALTSRLILA